MSACRRAAEQFENLSADVSGSGLYNPRSEPGDWELNCPLRSTEEDWSGSVEPFPANMDDLGKFAGAQRTADAAQECLLEHNGGCRLPVIFGPQPTCSLVGGGLFLLVAVLCWTTVSRSWRRSFPGSAKLSPEPGLRAPERPRRAGSSKKLRD